MAFSDFDFELVKKHNAKSSEIVLSGNMCRELLYRLECAERIVRLMSQGFGGHVLNDAMAAWRRSIVKESD